MPEGHLDAVEEHLPDGASKARVLVISDYRPLNLLHADALSDEGYAVYTAVTCTDVHRIFERLAVEEVNAVVFASLVHGWHHREAEEPPDGMSQAKDRAWQIRNICEVVNAVRGRQTKRPKVMIAVELMAYAFYDVTADALTAAGIEFHVYPGSDPHAIVDFLR